MNNSFPRLIDGVCATLRSEVLERISDEYARSQVYGVINLLNTFKMRADWSSGFLLQQIEAQRIALAVATEVFTAAAPPTPAPAPPVSVSVSVSVSATPQAAPIADLLALRDEGNRALSVAGAWLDSHGGELAPADAQRLAGALQAAMRAEVEIELQHSPRSMFAEMSGAAEL